MIPLGQKRTPPSILLYVHARTDLALRHADDAEVLGDLNRWIEERGGIILANGQILTRPLQKDWILDEHFDDDTTSEWDHPLRDWSREQAQFFSSLFGADRPFQFGERGEAYGRYCLSVRMPGNYLTDDERILGIVDAGRDNRNFYCPCHYAEVVYTTRNRLVCMMCGQMHCVLREPLPGLNGKSVPEAAWHEGFDTEGVLLANDLRLPFVEYQDIFAASKIWETDAWIEASSEIEFLERGDPDEVARYRASLPTAEDFIEAGWTEMPMPPSPARQMEPDGVEIDIGSNAALALTNAAEHYARSATSPHDLRSTVLDLFQGIELLLKIKLETLTGESAVRRRTNVQVLRTLAEYGAGLAAADEAIVVQLRSLRNKLQHNEGRFGFADARQLVERAFVFVDRFAWAALGWWIADAIEAPAWDALLRLPSIAESATQRSEELVARWRQEDGLNSVEPCPHCSRMTVLRERSHAGFCVYCRRLPVLPPDPRDLEVD